MCQMRDREKPKFEYEIRILNKFRKPLRAALEEHHIPKREHDYYWLIVSLVQDGMVASYKEEFLVTGKKPSMSTWHTRLYSTFLHARMGNKYLEVFRNLDKWGIIVRGQGYTVGTPGKRGLSKPVWFGFDFARMLRDYCYAKDIQHSHGLDLVRNGGCMSRKAITSKVLLKRLEKCAADRKRDQMKNPVVKDAHDNLVHFHIDEERANKALQELDISESRKHKEMKKVKRFNSSLESDTSLYVVQDEYGRVHTNITQMKKEIRERALTCDGGPVTEVDIKSSQGAFLCYILGSYIHGNEAAVGRNGKSFIALPLNFVDQFDHDRLEQEYGDFLGKLKQHGLYEFFASEMSEDFDLDMRVDRDMAKKAFLATLFAGVHLPDNCDETWHACRRVWEEHYPTLLALVDAMKLDNYRALAYEMQRMESSFVFDAVIPKIREQLGCPYCTVHDSLIVPSGYGEAVKKLMDHELDTFGIPTMTVEEGDMIERVVNDMPAKCEVAFHNDWGREADMELIMEAC